MFHGTPRRRRDPVTHEPADRPRTRLPRPGRPAPAPRTATPVTRRAATPWARSRRGRGPAPLRAPPPRGLGRAPAASERAGVVWTVRTARGTGVREPGASSPAPAGSDGPGGRGAAAPDPTQTPAHPPAPEPSTDARPQRPRRARRTTEPVAHGHPRHGTHRPDPPPPPNPRHLHTYPLPAAPTRTSEDLSPAYTPPSLRRRSATSGSPTPPPTHPIVDIRTLHLRTYATGATLRRQTPTPGPAPSPPSSRVAVTDSGRTVPHLLLRRERGPPRPSLGVVERGRGRLYDDDFFVCLL